MAHMVERISLSEPPEINFAQSVLKTMQETQEVATTRRNQGYFRRNSTTSTHSPKTCESEEGVSTGMRHRRRRRRT